MTERASQRSAASTAQIEALSLNGTCHLVVAIAAAQDNDRALAHRHLDHARQVAARIGRDRDDYGTELGARTSPSTPAPSPSSWATPDDLQLAEQITSNHTRTHRVAGDVTRDRSSSRARGQRPRCPGRRCRSPLGARRRPPGHAELAEQPRRARRQSPTTMRATPRAEDCEYTRRSCTRSRLILSTQATAARNGQSGCSVSRDEGVGQPLRVGDPSQKDSDGLVGIRSRSVVEQPAARRAQSARYEQRSDLQGVCQGQTEKSF